MPRYPGPEEFLADLNDAQREAVLHTDGPLLILAGPGSGKTRVITRRIVHLLAQGVRPANMLAVTFTNKAAGEMRERVAQLLPDSEPGRGGVAVPPHRFLRISTFHSFGVYMLRVYADRLGLEKNFTIYDQGDRNRMVKNALAAADIDHVRFTPESIESAISKAKNNLLTPEKYAAQARDFFSQTVAHVYPFYEKKMRDANAVDFDDLLLFPALALKNNEELRAELDARYQYILIDEYQDTNKAQYEVVHALARDVPNLCVVGDPDQSIYKWRGSDIRNILDFEKDYPSARVILLERNYRSTKAVLQAADSVIAHNRERKPKTLFTDNPEGQPVGVLRFETGQDEAEQVALRIQKAVQEGGRRYRDFAIFLRINALSRNVEAACVKHRIPFQMVRGLAFFERKENRDVLAYLRLLINPRDDLSFLRVVNEPARGIGKTSLDHLRNYAEPRELCLLSAAAEVDKVPAIKGKAATGLRSFVATMIDLRGKLELPPDELIADVLDRSGYRRMYEDSKDPDDAERLANIEELITAARLFVAEDPSRTLADFLENITLASDVDAWDEEQDCVSVMTLHAAKGLEFPVVYMLAVEQGILPHERSLVQRDDLEEERRLAFVGMTRAMEELYLTHAKIRDFRGQSLYVVPSMFLDELPAGKIQELDLAPRAVDAAGNWRGGGEDTHAGWHDAGIAVPMPKATAVQEPAAQADLDEGTMVRHDVYGLGRITQVSGHGAARKVKIRFSTGGERTFLAAKARLEIVRKN